MYFHAGLILFVIAVSFGVAKALKLSVELSMLVAALAAAIVHSGGAIPVRHLVEGSFTYLDVCLIFITATFFMNLIKESGGVAFLVRGIVTAFHKSRVLCLFFLTLLLLIPGALTGSGATTVLTVGTLVGTVLTYMGISEKRVAAIIFVCAAMSAAAPPVNLWAMMAAAGSNMPYVGFFIPLLVLSLAGSLFAMFFLGGKGKKVELDEALKELPEPPAKMNWIRVGMPFVVLIFLIMAGRIWPHSIPTLGLPFMFVVASIFAIILSPKKLEILRIASDTINTLIPLVGIMIVVGILIQIMALSGARGLISLAVVTLPMWVLFAALWLILPVSEGLLQYAVAPLLGVPLILLFNMKGMDAIIALSAMAVMWPVGDILPPTAVVGRATVMELKFKGHYYRDFLKTSLIPMGFILLIATLFLIFSNELSFLVGG
ncbi:MULTISPECIES: C4-dicarboxylate ABC transporter [Mesotoga]|uniref:C4-dicarboxylate ABC transporter n=1 Tax=Mesotoga TaxID=1184396 RepID=UPI000EF174F0|nr:MULTISPECIES: C4-dicarboxylate ABC transporter [Mesotoga]MCP5457537.1 C4-dicarboxylate ABC transporter [Thermotogota bacterium]MCP5461220.1 C4-dicarboxylate ABC transporter [Thermotogota bacterium]RLL84663.1 C4-dicarboxylate ABC transporter [Mesotoga sp. H07pep.5.4]HNQ71302.1 C4-dicarboxylate ABC transporter [Mesotoga prima]HNS76316.1 C4-dicarboxylate ABC transporter [Mesotoga prima]